MEDLEDIEGQEEQERAFRTFRNYLRAWVLVIETEVGTISDDCDYLSRVVAVPKLRTIQRKNISHVSLQSNYLRGALNLKAMRAVPLEEFPQLAPALALWLPVQAYYSVHGLGVATLSSFGFPVPYTHEKFRRMMSENVVPARFPGVLGTRVTWSGLEGMEFEGLDVDDSSVRAQSNLQNPTGTNARLLIGKCLATTRREDHKSDLIKERKRLRRKRLRVQQRENKKWNLHSTSIVDFLWRLRVRTNYSDPDMYLQPFRDENDASKFCADLVMLTAYVVLTLKATVRMRIGATAFEQLERPLTS